MPLEIFVVNGDMSNAREESFSPCSFSIPNMSVISKSVRAFRSQWSIILMASDWSFGTTKDCETNASSSKRVGSVASHVRSSRFFKVIGVGLSVIFGYKIMMGQLIERKRKFL